MNTVLEKNIRGPIGSMLKWHELQQRLLKGKTIHYENGRKEQVSLTGTIDNSFSIFGIA
jgi:hypothetical protein